jgi:hypothetical protein
MLKDLYLVVFFAPLILNFPFILDLLSYSCHCILLILSSSIFVTSIRTLKRNSLIVSSTVINSTKYSYTFIGFSEILTHRRQ